MARRILRKITKDIAERYARRAVPLAKSGLKAARQHPLATTRGSVKFVAKKVILPAAIASEAYKTGKKIHQFAKGIKEYKDDTKKWVAQINRNDRDIKLALARRKKRMLAKK